MMPARTWHSTTGELPAGELLVWSSGRCVVAVLVSGQDDTGAWREFMDVRNDELIEWPTHWMPLPSPPA